MTKYRNLKDGSVLNLRTQKDKYIFWAFKEDGTYLCWINQASFNLNYELLTTNN